MLIDQEGASIARFMIEAADSIKPYFEDMPQDFVVPSIYFPEPEAEPSGDTSVSFAVDFVMYVKVFHSSTASAWEKGYVILKRIMEVRKLIPLYNADGSTAGRGIRVKDPKLRKIADGTVQLEIGWKKYLLYDIEPSTLAEEFHITFTKEE